MGVNPKTMSAVVRQLKAMCCSAFDVALKNFETGAAQYWRDMSESDVVRRLQGRSGLVARHCQGENIYVRPAESVNRALVLVDDVEELDVERLEAEGMEPCLVVETSPKNLQVWLDLGEEPMRPMERKVTARRIADWVGGDIASVGASHFGRLAGFRNLKPSHFGEGGFGQFPFVKVLKASRTVCSNAMRAREWARKEAGRIEAARLFPASSGCRRVEELPAAWAGYCRQWDEHPHALRPDGTPDLSERDWYVVCRLLRDGFDGSDVVEHLARVSDRKGAGAESYARRTVSAARART